MPGALRSGGSHASTSPYGVSHTLCRSLFRRVQRLLRPYGSTVEVGLRKDSCCILHLALAACPNLPRRRTPSTSDKPAPRMIKMTNQQTEFGHATQVTIMGQRLGLGLGLGLGF